MTDYLPILVMLILASAFAAGSFVASTLLAPKRPTAAKLAPYECGIVPEYEPAERFPVKFYLVAMVFIVFDIELVFLYPWAVIFRRLELFGLVEMGLFLATVVVAFAYVLSVGALDWGPARRMSEFAGRPILRASAWPPPEKTAAETGEAA
ncbi:MAG TPA: NADH-quinone oxidoreductase subunit A [Acidimicrobiia bacterium]|nr:NADH-quinone oxidoreductase subunit A [Acidimicrobiia bacterium]